MGAVGKYNSELVDKICSLIEQDTYTIEEICKNVGIVESTYYEWKATKEEFSEAIKKAEKKRMEKLAVAARNSLMKLVCGYEVINTKIKKGKDSKVIEEVIETKNIEPNTAAVIFALTNSDPDNFKNKQFNVNNEIGSKPIGDFKTFMERIKAAKDGLDEEVSGEVSKGQ
jgi:predicted CopG family antitoxin